MNFNLRDANEKRSPHIYRPEEHQNEAALNKRHPIYKTLTIREFNFIKTRVDNVDPASILMPNVTNLENFITATNACNVPLPIWLVGVVRPISAE